jgi:molybdopterin converting factor small subunit
VRVIVDIVSAAKLGPDNGPLEVEIPVGSTLEDLIAELVALGGEPVRKRILRESDGQPYVMFVVNGEPIECADELHDGDEVLIVPPIGGG